MSPSKAENRCAKYVALLRGINVGGKHILPMKHLSGIFSNAKCGDVRTYIQSGNVIFSAPAGGVEKIPQLIAKSIESQFGFPVPVILRSSDEIARVLRDNPFLKAGASEKALYVYFLADHPAKTAVAKLDPKRSVPDEYRVVGREIYMHLPNGMGRSKLTSAYFDSQLSTVATARNWATVMKINELMQS
jgi:uncharacterized protein (DUF1697 family)